MRSLSPVRGENRDRFIKAAWAAKLAGTLPANAYLLARSMLRHADPKGRLWPSLETLGNRIGVCARTISRLIDALHELGLLTWCQRHGKRHRRDTNLYQLLIPSPAVPDAPREEKIPFESSSAKLSDGLSRALQRLGRVLGVPSESVMPWLPSCCPAATAEGRG